jgi:hypothetical protein
VSKIIARAFLPVLFGLNIRGALPSRILNISSQHFRYTPRLGNAAAGMVWRVAVEYF